MGNSFQDNKPPPKDDQPLINKLKDTAEQVLEEEVVQELRTEDAKKAAYLLASQNVVKLVYIGGCSRAYSQLCPKGWAEASVRVACVLRRVYRCALMMGVPVSLRHDVRRQGHARRRTVRLG